MPSGSSPRRRSRRSRPAGSSGTTYGEWAERTRRLAGVLDALEISADGRVGTFAWNTARHLELYFAAPCSGPRPAHAEHPAVPGRHRLHRRPRRGRGRLRRPLAAEALLAAGRPLRDRQARRRDGRRRRRGDPRRPARARLRGAAGRGRAGRVPTIDDENQAAAMCYTSGTTGHPKGVVYSHRSTVLHSMGSLVADAAGGQRARHDHAGRADVPRQRVGPLPGRGDGRRVARDARAEHAAEGARGADGVREGHAGRGRADDLDGRPARARRAATSPRCARSCAAAPRCRSSLSRGLPRADRAADPAGLGDDRDVARSPRPGAIKSTLLDRSEDELADLRAAQGLAIPLVDLRIVEPGHRRGAAVGRRGARRAAGARPVDRGRLLQRRALGGLLHRGRLAAHRRRRDDQPRTATSGSSTAPRTS